MSSTTLLTPTLKPSDQVNTTLQRLQFSTPNELIQFDDDDRGIDQEEQQAREDKNNVEDDDLDMTEERMAELLKEAEERLRTKATVASRTAVSTVSFPKLDPGPFFKAPPKSASAIDLSRIATPQDIHYANNPYPLPAAPVNTSKSKTTIITKKQRKEEEEKTAGPKWFDMPRTDLTPSVKRDLQILKNRDILDPKRHYKQGVIKGFPKYSQMGTIIEGNTEFFSARLTRKARKQTILGEVLASDSTIDRFKRKNAEIDAQKRAGKKEYYKKVKAKRSKI